MCRSKLCRKGVHRRVQACQPQCAAFSLGLSAWLGFSWSCLVMSITAAGYSACIFDVDVAGIFKQKAANSATHKSIHLQLAEISMAEENKQQPEGDTPDFNRKHPLEHKWTLWFDNPSTRQTLNKYGQGLRPVYSFDTVEDFWWYVTLSTSFGFCHGGCL